MNAPRSWIAATLIAVTVPTPARAQTPPPAIPTPTAEAATPTDDRDFAGPEVVAPTPAEPLATSRDAVLAFEGGFAAGQALLERGAPLAAARTWVETSALLPETAENRDNRAAVFNYIAEAYERALAGDASRARIEEALAAFDAYTDGVTAAYGPDAALVPRVVDVRDSLRARLATMDRVPAPRVVAPIEAPKPAVTRRPEAPRAWAGLAAGGGAALGVGVGGLAMMTLAAVRGHALDRRFDDPTRGCDRNAPTGECGEIYSAGKAMNDQMIVGAVIGAVGLVTGTTLVALAHRRRTRVSPQAGPGYAGLAIQGRF